MNDEALAVTLARIEGKLDLIDLRTSHLAMRGDDHEARIRAIELRPVVTPKAFVSALVAVATVIGATTPLLARIYN